MVPDRKGHLPIPAKLKAQAKGDHMNKAEAVTLAELIVKAIVDRPDAVIVRSVTGEEATIVEIRVDRNDLRHVIGRGGQMAESIRTIVCAVGSKLKLRLSLSIIE